MKIEGNDFMDWLHTVREKMWEEQKKSGLSGVAWIRKITQEAEKIIGHPIPKINSTRRL